MMRNKPSIRLLVISIVALPIVLLSVALVGINNHLGSQIGNTLSTTLARATAQQIRMELQNQLVQAERLSELYNYRFRNNFLPSYPTDEWAARFQESMLIRPEIAAVTFALEDGRTVYLMRVGERMVVGRSDDPVKKQITDYNIDFDGNIDYTHPMNVHIYDPTQRPWYKDIQSSNGPKWTDVYKWFDNNQFTETGTNVIGLGYLRQLKKGDVSGVLLVDISLASVSKQLAGADLAKLGTVILLDEKNRVIARSDQQFSARDATLVPISEMKDNDAVAVAEAIQLDGVERSEHRLTQLGRTVQIEPIKPSSGLRWHMATVIPDRDITGQISTMFNNTAAIIVVVTIITLGIAFWMTHWAVRPISQLAAHTREIGAGNFDRTIQLSSTAEFEQLSESFNAMTASLKEQFKLRADNEAAQQSLKSRNAFFNRITHELRTPLNAIIGYSEMLDENPAIRSDREAHEDLRKLRLASKNLLGLINDLLDLARIDSGGMTVENQLIDLKKFMQEIEEITRPLVIKNANAYQVHCERDLSIRSDQQKLGQILINLIANAGKYTHRGSVDVSVSHDEAYIHIRITDTGKGIPPDKIKTMFEPFTRGKSGTTGTGLGLSIARQLTNVLGGEIEMTSNIGIGTTVDLYFPSDPAVIMAGRSRQVGP